MRIILMSVLFSLIASCTASIINKNIINTNIQDNRQDVEIKAERLKKAYQNLSSFPHLLKYEKEYFDAFPSSFGLFNRIFGDINKEPMEAKFEPGPLYNESDLYIEAFFNLNGVEKTQYYNRIIEICMNGRWDADAVNYFKYGTQNKVKADINLFSKLLLKRSDKEIIGFWYFYFDGPHPAKKIPDELQKVKKINSRLYSLMELALKKVQQAEKE